MEFVSFRLEKSVLKQIENGLKQFNYSTKSDFFRDSVREKLSRLQEEHSRKKAWNALSNARGVFKGKGSEKTDEEYRKIREDAGKEFMEILEKRFNQK